MRTVDVQMSVPEGLAPFLSDMDQNASFERNAMLLYPFIQRSVISHGRAAEILGIPKWNLIEFYDGLGIPYLNQSREELMADLRTYDRIKEKRQ